MRDLGSNLSLLYINSTALSSVIYDISHGMTQGQHGVIACDELWVSIFSKAIKQSNLCLTRLQIAFLNSVA